MDATTIHVVSKEHEEEFHDEMVVRIRDKVKALLKERKLSLKAFARQSNLEYAILHRALFLGDTVTVRTLSRVAIGFGIDIQDLVK